jgi:hypothetical protein
MQRNGTMLGSPTARSRRAGWLHARAWQAAAFALAALALAGCSSFGLGQSEQPAIDPNTFPADYKSGLMTFLQTNPFGLVGAREASLSPPELKPFGNENRYVACLRVAGPDWRKEKMVVYYGGAINQFVDASELCKSAVYQSFPELPAMFAQLRTKK